MTKLTSLSLVFFVLANFLFVCGCENKAEKDVPSSHKELPALNETVSPNQAAFQKDLIDIAFDISTSIPIKPHIKDRSRAQENVVKTAIKLGQLGKAVDYITKIDNWRRGSCYADVALYYAEVGDINNATKYLSLAEKVSVEGVDGGLDTQEKSQQWRKDHIKVKMAQTYAILGQTKLAQDIENSLDADSFLLGQITTAKSKITDVNSFEEQVKKLDSLIAIGNFDITKNSLDGYAHLFNRFYSDPDKRQLSEEKIKTYWDKMPFFIRIDLLVKLADFSISNLDKPKAIDLVNESQAIMDSCEWLPEDYISIVSKLSSVRYKAGDTDRAMADADKAFLLFNEKKEQIVDIYRAKAIRPLAESYQLMGDEHKALAVYKIAIEEGIKNPNSRPRAEDLSATCSSMALVALEPDAQLWVRIHQIYEGLGNPW